MSLQRICSHATFYAGGVKLCLKTAHKRKICKTASITGLLLRFIAIFRVNSAALQKTGRTYGSATGFTDEISSAIFLYELGSIRFGE